MFIQWPRSVLMEYDRRMTGDLVISEILSKRLDLSHRFTIICILYASCDLEFDEDNYRPIGHGISQIFCQEYTVIVNCNYCWNFI